MLTRIVKMQFESAFTEDFKIIFKEVKPLIANFEGCLGVKLLQHETASDIFFTISYWENAMALEKYRNSALFTNTWLKVKINFASKAEAWSLIEQ
ncbi:putative quinol monooxygenase [Pedobacter namyangjuensis]|uniref:putative quinol monooxygenase n=1 Tax=Pedobacter namyangjuensis TaxID=600626 RepID=UPI000DE56346|nr:antibiotic biosynthesis monooxygenase family protein [Pedobacter namyangjuensis]